MSGEARAQTTNRNSLQQKFHNVLRIMDHVNRLGTDGHFDPDILQVGLSNIDLQRDNSEFVKFLKSPRLPDGLEDRSNFSAAGLNVQEFEEATLKFDASSQRFLDKDGNVANISNRIYNVTKNGKLVVQPNMTMGAFHHSSITRDGSIICAGFIELKDGKITKIDNTSGHYQPGVLHLYNAIKKLQSKGEVFADDCELNIYQLPKIKTVADFMRSMEEVQQGTGLSKAEILRQQVRDEYRRAVVKHEFQAQAGQSLADTILATNLELKAGDINRYNLPVHLFDKEFVDAYRLQKTGSPTYDIRSITLDNHALFEYLLASSKTAEEKDKAIATINRMLSSGAAQDRGFDAELLGRQLDATGPGQKLKIFSNLWDQASAGNIELAAKNIVYLASQSSTAANQFLASGKNQTMLSMLSTHELMKIYDSATDKEAKNTLVQFVLSGKSTAFDDAQIAYFVLDSSRRDPTVANAYLTSEHVQKLCQGASAYQLRIIFSNATDANAKSHFLDVFLKNEHNNKAHTFMSLMSENSKFVDEIVSRPNFAKHLPLLPESSRAVFEKTYAIQQSKQIGQQVAASVVPSGHASVPVHSTHGVSQKLG